MSVTQPILSQTLIHLQGCPETKTVQYAQKISKYFENNPQETGYSQAFSKWFDQNCNELRLDTTHPQYINALRAIQNSKGPLREKSPQELISAIMNLYRLVNPSTENGYRNAPVTIVNPNFTVPKNSSKELRTEVFKKHWDQYFQNTSSEDYATYKKLRGKIWKFYFKTEYQGSLAYSCQESLFLIKHNRLLNEFVPPSQLENETKAFAANFLEQCNSINDVQTALKVMAFAHYHLIRLHMKFDRNGTVARLFMHWIALDSRKRGIDVNPILIEDAKAYDKAAGDLEKFESLVTTLHEKQTEMTMHPEAHRVLEANITNHFGEIKWIP